MAPKGERQSGSVRDQVVALMRSWVAIGNALHQQIELILRLPVIDAGAQHAQHIEPGDAAVVDARRSPNLPVHAQRNPELGAKPALASLKAARQQRPQWYRCAG